MSQMKLALIGTKFITVRLIQVLGFDEISLDYSGNNFLVVIYNW